MTLGGLLKNEWRSFKRASMFSANIGMTIFLGIFIVYFIMCFLAFGFLAESMVAALYPDRNFVLVVSSFVLLYYLLDIVMRYFLQRYASIQVKSYLLLPIKKSKIVDYFLLRSLSSYFNYLPLFFIVPFFLVHMTSLNTLIQVNFLCFVLGAILFNNYLVFGINKLLQVRPWLPIVFLLLLVVSLFLAYHDFIPLFDWLIVLSELILISTLVSLVPLLMAIGLYIWIRRYLCANLNIEDDPKSISSLVIYPSFGFYKYLGRIGHLMDLEVKLIARSKRARTAFFVGLLFVFYPYASGAQDSDIIAVSYSIMGSGMFALSYGQLMLSWNSMHFDLLQTRQIDLRDIFTAKYYLLVLACLFTSVTLVFFAMCVYNMSFSISIYMYLASYNSHRIDPNESGLFNQNGIGVSHFLIIFPILILPIVLFILGKQIDGFYSGILMILLPSIVLLIFYERAIGFCYRNFLKNRYRITAAFRKK